MNLSDAKYVRKGGSDAPQPLSPGALAGCSLHTPLLNCAVPLLAPRSSRRACVQHSLELCWGGRAGFTVVLSCVPACRAPKGVRQVLPFQCALRHLCGVLQLRRPCTFFFKRPFSVFQSVYISAFNLFCLESNPNLRFSSSCAAASVRGRPCALARTRPPPSPLSACHPSKIPRLPDGPPTEPHMPTMASAAQCGRRSSRAEPLPAARPMSNGAGGTSRNQ